MKPFILLGLAAVAAICGAAPALAQANRTFVSGSGNDSNPCSLPAPCRSFAQALTQTNPGGDIVVLDSAGYGQVRINKAVSIVNQDGVVAGVTVSSLGDGITVAAGASDVVNLRGLTLVGLSTGSNGITFSSGKSLNIDKCEIRGFLAGGISMANNVSANLTVTDTTVSNNFEGVFIAPATNIGLSTVTLSRLHATGNGATGVSVSPLGGSHVSVAVVDSLLDNNFIGIVATASHSNNSALANVVVDNSKLFSISNGSALPVNLSANGDGVTIEVGRTQVNSSVLGSMSNGGDIQSLGNNQGFFTLNLF